MSAKRYIDIDSSFRNRERFSNPAQFDILISQTGRKSNVFTAIDPIAESVTVFPPPNLNVGATYNSFSYIYPTSIDPLTFQIDGIEVDSTNTAINYLPPENAENYYINKIIENISDGSFRMITDYHTNNVVTDYDTGLVDGSMTVADTNILILGANTLPFTFHSDITDYYVGKLVDVGGQTASIVAYNPSDAGHGGLPVITVTPDWRGDASSLGGMAYSIYSNIAHYITLSEQFGGGPITTNPPATTINQTQYRIRGNVPFEVGTLVSATSNSFTLPASSSSINNYYVGTYMWIPDTREYRLIVNYDGSTRTGVVSSPFNTTPGPSDSYNILQFSRDNFSPLVYTGSTVSRQQMTCYEIELISLILPNLVLSSGFGNLIAFYPYVYVEFSNITGMNNNILYSNNPFTTNVLFKVPIDDVNTPRASSFISVDGHGMVQTIKFKPNDNFRISVRLPNGDIFETEEKDYVSPSPPNPKVQLSVTFAIRQLETAVEEQTEMINQPSTLIEYPNMIEYPNYYQYINPSTYF